MIKRAFDKAMKTVHDADAYGHSITLNYNRHGMFKTKLGGLSTIILGLGMAVYFVFLLWGLFAKSTINYTVSTKVSNLSQNTETYALGKSGFFMAIGLSGSEHSLFDDDRKNVFDLWVYEDEWILNEAGEWINNVKNLTLEVGGDKFPFHDKGMIKGLYLDKYIGVTSDDFVISGDFYSRKSKMIYIQLFPGTNSTGTTGASQEEIDRVVNDNVFDVIFLDNYFDVSNFDNPIQSFITQKYSYSLMTEVSKNIKLLIKENTVKLMDSIFQYQSYDERKFYSISDEQVDAAPRPYYINMRISPDHNKDTHTRTVYSMFDMLAQIGGVYGVFSSIAFFILGSYAEKMMYYTVLRRSYQFDSKEANEMPVYNEDDGRQLSQFKTGDPIKSPSKENFLKEKDSFRSPTTLNFNLNNSRFSETLDDSTDKEEFRL